MAAVAQWPCPLAPQVCRNVDPSPSCVVRVGCRDRAFVVPWLWVRVVVLVLGPHSAHGETEVHRSQWRVQLLQTWVKWGRGTRKWHMQA